MPRARHPLRRRRDPGTGRAAARRRPSVDRRPRRGSAQVAARPGGLCPALHLRERLGAAPAALRRLVERQGRRSRGLPRIRADLSLGRKALRARIAAAHPDHGSVSRPRSPDGDGAALDPRSDSRRCEDTRLRPCCPQLAHRDARAHRIGHPRRRPARRRRARHGQEAGTSAASSSRRDRKPSASPPTPTTTPPRSRGYSKRSTRSARPSAAGCSDATSWQRAACTPRPSGTSPTHRD